MTKGVVRNRIKELRQAPPAITQQTLADMVGATRQTILAIEAEKYSPSLELAFRIARAFGKPFEEVFWYEGDDEELP